MGSWIELENNKGGKQKYIATGLLKGNCTGCQAICLATANMGAMACTHCGGKVNWKWFVPQLSFIPEEENNSFPSPTPITPESSNGDQQG